MRGMETLEQAVGRALERTMNGHTPGCALLLARGGEVLLRTARGMADLEHGVAAAAENRFVIASNTKQFACFAILMLRDRGLLTLDEPVARFFPDFPPYRERVTVRMLMSHTSGIREYFENATEADEALLRRADAGDILNLLRGYGDELDFAPDTRWSYCNSGFVMLGEIVRQLTGKSFGRFLESEVFVPLGMRDSRAPENVATQVDALVPGYSDEQNPGVFLCEPRDMMQVGYADGNVVSTVDDLLKWHRFLFGSDGAPPVRPGTLREMFTPHRLADGTDTHYGLGFCLDTTDAERPRYCAARREIFHTGHVPGFVSRISYFPDDEVSAILLTNWSGVPRDAVFFAVLDELFRRI